MVMIRWTRHDRSDSDSCTARALYTAYGGVRLRRIDDLSDGMQSIEYNYFYDECEEHDSAPIGNFNVSK